jgi:hypothetical protein
MSGCPMAAPGSYALGMETVGEPEEIRIPREDETPVVVPAEEPQTDPEPQREPEQEDEPVPL